jgi:hypothetical protein
VTYSPGFARLQLLVVDRLPFGSTRTCRASFFTTSLIGTRLLALCASAISMNRRDCPGSSGLDLGTVLPILVAQPHKVEYVGGGLTVFDPRDKDDVPANPGPWDVGSPTVMLINW